MTVIYASPFMLRQCLCVKEIQILNNFKKKKKKKLRNK